MRQDSHIHVKNIPAKPEPFDPTQRVYVRAVHGVYQRLRRNMGWLLMLLFFGLPWLRFHGQQAVLFDLSQQRFTFFATSLFPQDLTLLAWLLIIAAFALFFITTFLGRVWCGFLCPQTVWTFIFIWFEERFEGSANQRRKLDQRGWDRDKLLRKTAKHLCWLGFSLLTALAFVSYFVPAQQLFREFFSGASSGWVVFWVLFFMLCTYGNAGWMRAIMCTHICPYARFQSAMFDRDTYIVGYDAARGETRGPRSRKADPKTLGLGDCIDCALCVQVCPTGIDIRHGLQYECINCGACVDACDDTMQKMGYAAGLISYTTEHKLAEKSAGNQQQIRPTSRVLRPKLLGYGLVLLVMVGLFTVNLLSLSSVNLDVLRDRNQLYRINNDGDVENTFILKVQNKTQQSAQYRLNVMGLPAGIQWYGPKTIEVAAGEIYTQPVSVAIAPESLSKAVTDITFTVSLADDADDIEARAESRFFTER
ncbi:MAG: cytochrome c oxidase accessory protein CcoG [Plesiomonas sp.]